MPVLRILRHVLLRYRTCGPLRHARELHLAPPFLLDDYIPRYQLLSSVDASKKRSAAYAHLRNCNLCPRLCGVNRYERLGACLIGAEKVKVKVIAPHFGEVPQVVLSILHARNQGLRVPIVYNTSAFDSLDSIHLLDGLVDIYLPDFKIWEKSTSKRLLKVEKYAETAMESIKAMQKQVCDLCFTPDGIAKKGLLVRHLVMPGFESEGQKIMNWMADNVSRDMFVNIMEQYHPDAHVGKAKRPRRPSSQVPNLENEMEPKDLVRYEEINRHVSNEEVMSVRHAAEQAGLWRFCDPPKHGGFAL